MTENLMKDVKLVEMDFENRDVSDGVALFSVYDL